MEKELLENKATEQKKAGRPKGSCKKEPIYRDDMVFIPLSGEELSVVDEESKHIYATLSDLQYNCVTLAHSVMKLSKHEASQICCLKQIQNMHNSVLHISQYIGIAKMLLDNMQDDLKFVYKQRKAFMQSDLLRRAKIIAEQKAAARNANERERIAAKRAEDPLIAKIAEKKYRHIR